jgi:tRNA nucleotidyltransferase (CCA-adding enzyme)
LTWLLLSGKKEKKEKKKKKVEMKNIKKILERQISKIKPAEEELAKINKETEIFLKGLQEKLKKNKIKAQTFVGGSIAKETLIKKDKYDVDIFVRFNKKYKDNEISELLEKIIDGKRIHGSRDYFQLSKNGVLFEVVPVIEIKKPKEARNVTDLSYFHVNYVKNKIKKKKRLAQEIMLAKAFCYANRCYGAESYINGFSGYALELLVIYYGSFIKFIKSVIGKDKLVLDPENFYKNKQEIMLELNESKLASPIVLVDPTFKQRNALAALSRETFQKFKEICSNFLKNPSERFFEKQNIEDQLRKKNKNLIVIETKSSRQKGDIAGSKLRKFNGYLLFALKEDFEIILSEFQYNEDENTGKNYLVLKQKKEILLEGPPITKIENLNNFKKAHENCFIKQGKAFAHEKTNNIKQAVDKLKKDKILAEMGITDIRLVS